MRYILFTILILIFLSPLWAQNVEDDMTSITVIYLDRVYIGVHGYKIVYGEFAPVHNVVYMPYGWFTEDWSSFARTFYTKKSVAPYLVVFFDEAGIVNLHLFLPEDLTHMSVRTLHNYDPDLREKFNLKPSDIRLFPDKIEFFQ